MKWRSVIGGVLALASAPAQAAWLEAKTPHFIIYSDQSQNGLAHYAQQLERFDQAVRPLLRAGDPPLSDGSKLTIYVLRNQSEVASLHGDSTVAGFYIPRASGALAFVHREEGTNDEQQLSGQTVFQHEYLHHLMLQNTGAPMPLWVTEGLAEFFGTAQVKADGSVAVGYVPQYRGYDLVTDKLPLEQMLAPRGTRISGADRSQIYARGWLLIHYLTFNKQRAGQLDRYLTLIGQGKPALDAAREGFGDLGRLDRELNSYLSGNRYVTSTIPAARIHLGAVSIRTLSPAEAAIIPVQMRSQRGVDSRTAPGVLQNAQRIAGQYPSDATVLAALAEAQQDAGDNSAAIVTADRASAADPRAQKPLVMKARAMLALARKSPKATDYAALRQAISKANRIDPNNAEPLLMFYETYALQGIAPTKNSVEGLYYAQALVPQDDQLRLAAAQQLAHDGRLPEAAQMFGPLAYNPHSTKATPQLLTVMAALQSGNRAEALAAFEALGKADAPASKGGD